MSQSSGYQLMIIMEGEMLGFFYSIGGGKELTRSQVAAFYDEYISYLSN